MPVVRDIDIVGIVHENARITSMKVMGGWNSRWGRGKSLSMAAVEVIQHPSLEKLHAPTSHVQDTAHSAQKVEAKAVGKNPVKSLKLFHSTIPSVWYLKSTSGRRIAPFHFDARQSSAMLILESL